MNVVAFFVFHSFKNVIRLIVLQPENLLVGHDGVLKLSYFGLSALSRQASVS